MTIIFCLIAAVTGWFARSLFDHSDGDPDSRERSKYYYEEENDEYGW